MTVQLILPAVFQLSFNKKIIKMPLTQQLLKLKTSTIKESVDFCKF